mgnify:CR=1 FL=1
MAPLFPMVTVFLRGAEEVEYNAGVPVKSRNGFDERERRKSELDDVQTKKKKKAAPFRLMRETKSFVSFLAGPGLNGLAFD